MKKNIGTVRYWVSAFVVLSGLCAAPAGAQVMQAFQSLLQRSGSTTTQNAADTTQGSKARQTGTFGQLQQGSPVTGTANALKQASVVAITPQLAMSSSDYPVTAGDIYILAFAAGTTPITYSISVDSSYKIRVANLAVLDAAGKTFVQLKKLVEEIVTKNYPMSGVQFVLLTPAIFKVTVTGEVQQTDIRQANALTRLSAIVPDLMTQYSSYRSVTITSQSGKKQNYDLFLAERFGDMSQDPYVRPDDVITINRLEKLATIDGAVERPGTYQLLSGDTLKDLVYRYGGGLTDYADTGRIELSRRTGNSSLRQKTYISKQDIDGVFPLTHLDQIYIPTNENARPVVAVEGAITFPATSEETNVTGVSTGPSYSSKTGNSSGSTQDAFQAVRITLPADTGTSYAFLVRQNRSIFTAVSDTMHCYIVRGEHTIALNASRILYDADYYPGETVQPDDTLVVPFRQMFVTVSGAVKNPGRYMYTPGQNWAYYVTLAGGFDKTENTSQAVIITDSTGKKRSKNDLIQPETVIAAKSNSFMFYFNRFAPLITVTGAVLTSIYYTQIITN